MASVPISIYAELLSNIRQISLAVSLCSRADSSTKITITHNTSASTVDVHHRGSASYLALPGRVSFDHGQELPIQRCSEDGKTLTWRLPLLRDSRRPEAASSAVPWEACDLVPGSAVSCRKCRATVVGQGVVNEWKDLPAEGWAEMMEFWHCHKPGDHHHHHHGHRPDGDGATGGRRGAEKADEETLATRGYGAASAISAQKGVGFVDLTTFLFHEGDVQGVTLSASSFDSGSSSLASLEPSPSAGFTNFNIFCAICRTRLGYFNHATSALTIFKWSVSFPTSLSKRIPLPSVSHCLASTLQATLARTNSSKSLLLPIDKLASPFPPSASEAPPPVLHFWVLNPSLRYTSTQMTNEGIVKAMKLLYRTVTPEEADKMLEDVNGDVQEVSLPEEAIWEVLGRLRESNAILPGTEKRLREWDVGMLGLWEGRD